MADCGQESQSIVQLRFTAAEQMVDCRQPGLSMGRVIASARSSRSQPTSGAESAGYRSHETREACARPVRTTAKYHSRQQNVALALIQLSSTMSETSETPCMLEEAAHQVSLNVAGHRYMSSLKTLRAYPQSKLAKVFEGQWRSQRNSEREVFIDRDGEVCGVTSPVQP